MSLDQISSALSRRNFMRLFGAGAAAVATLPTFDQHAFAQQVASASTPTRRRGMGRRRHGRNAPALARHRHHQFQRESAGACAVSAGAMVADAPTGGRYDKFGVARATVETISEQFGLKPGYVELYPGSGGPLDMALMSNISPDRGLVCGDPSYEQGPRAADGRQGAAEAGAAHQHLRARRARPWWPPIRRLARSTSSIPNNPTGTMTPKEDILWLLEEQACRFGRHCGRSVLSTFPTHESVIDQVAADQDIIVLRTFSKIYGMAGIRAGFAFARPDLLEKFQSISPEIRLRNVASVSLISAAMAGASLRDPNLVPTRRKINTDNREATLEFLEKNGYKYHSRFAGELLHGRRQASGT